MDDAEPLPADRRQARRETRAAGAARSQSRRPGRPRLTVVAENSQAPVSDGRAPTAAAAVPEWHRRQLEALLDVLRVALELETRFDFGDGPQADGPGRVAFLAHFDGWRKAL